MATPKWEPGKLYPTGSLVVPRTAVNASAQAIPNASFEDGATGWDLGANWNVITGSAYIGTHFLRYTGNGQSTTGEIAAHDVVAGQSITASAFTRMEGGSDNQGCAILLVWYTEADVFISIKAGPTIPETRGQWQRMSVTGTAPGNARKVRVVFSATNNTGGWPDAHVDIDGATWNYVPPVTAGLQYKAVQPTIGTSDNVEPVWPGTVGVQVIDNTVIWEAVLLTRIVYEARPILISGPTEPDWPQEVGAYVADNTISWETASRQVTEAPNSKVVAITASKVFAADRDIIRYSATVNPLDWTSTDNAGYLPSGLNQNGSNDTAVLNIYRSNLVAFSSSTFQNWQVDEDPANMELLDVMEGIGSTWQHAAQPVARDLFYLAALGVRTVGISGGSLNLVNGDAGMPIDPLVRASIKTAIEQDATPRGMYYPSLGQYMLAFPEFPEDEDASTTTYAYSMNSIGEVGAWSVYEYPWPVEADAMLGNDLYLRSGDAVFRIDPSRVHDQNAAGEDVEVIGEIQSHYLDMGSPAVTKMMVGVDLVGNGVARIALGYNQTNLSYFTPDAEVPADTVPGSIIPIPLAAPSFAMRIRYSSIDNPDGWEWLASSFYINDFRPAV